MLEQEKIKITEFISSSVCSQKKIDSSYEVIIVGSGAAGSWAAKKLTEGGKNALLLEAGDNLDIQRDFSNSGSNIFKNISARFNQHIQMLCTAYNANPLVRKFYINDLKNPYTTSFKKPFIWIRGRQLGGRLHCWARHTPRMSDFEFKAAIYDGYGEVWPLSYDDLKPYYQEIEKYMGLHGDFFNSEASPDGCYVASHPLNEWENNFKVAVEKNFNKSLITSARVVEHNVYRIPRMLLDAHATGRLTLRCNSIVTKILLNSEGNKFEGVEFIDSKTKKVYRAFGKILMVCASTIESIRLFLNSKSENHPSGLANSSGYVGKGIMDNTKFLLGGRLTTSSASANNFNYRVDDYDCGYANGFYIPRFQNLREKTTNYLRGFSCQGSIGRVSYKNDKLWGIVSFGEMLSYPENRVYIDLRKNDVFGIPVPRIECSYGLNEKEMLKDQIKTLYDMAKIGGLDVKLHSNWLLDKIINSIINRINLPGSSIHEVGGIRMGQKPETSVLNPYNECWDIKNIFVTDGSCFVSSGCQNPTLTIMAITVRCCKYILNKL